MAFASNPFRLVLAGYALLIVSSCATLPSIDSDACGNLVVQPERGEDCEFSAHRPDAKPACWPPGTPHECRWRCSPDDAVSGCPAGYVCGLDEVCRAPSGQFAPAELVFLGESALELTAADFDGDGRDDLLTSEPRQVAAHFFDWSGTVATTTPVFVPDLTPPAAPGIGQLTEDTLPDLAFGSGEATYVYRPRSDRSFVPTTYPSIPLNAPSARVHFLDGLPSTTTDSNTEVGRGLELLVLAEDGDHTRITSPSTGEGDGTRLDLSLPGAPRDWSLASGRFDTRPEGPLCDSLVVARRDASSVAVLPMCASPENSGASRWWWNHGDPSHPQDLAQAGVTISLPSGYSISDPCGYEARCDSRAIFVLDINADEALDLLIVAYSTPVQGGEGGAGGDGPLPPDGGGVPVPGDEEPGDVPVPLGPPALLIAYGLGDGNFYSTSDGAQLTNEASKPTNAPWSLANSALTAARLLAAGDVNGDGAIDLVLSDRLLRSSSTAATGPLDATYEEDEFGPWFTAAEIADVNHDGVFDIVAIAPNPGRLFLLQGSPNGGLSPFVTLLGDVPLGLTLGDFDGDTLDDAAVATGTTGFIETYDGSTTVGDDGSVPDALAIAFGAPYGNFDPPVDVGYLDRIQSLTSGNLQEAEFADGMDELLVVSLAGTTQSPAARLALLAGNTDRQLTAPLLLEEPNGRGAALPISVVADDFVADDASHADLAVLGVSDDLTQTCPWVGAAPATSASSAAQLWLLESSSEAAITGGLTSRFDLASSAANDVAWRYAIATEMQLGEQDGEHELVLLAPTLPGGTSGLLGVLAVLRATGQDPAAWQLVGPDGQPTTEVQRFGSPAIAFAALRLTGRCLADASEEGDREDSTGGFDASAFRVGAFGSELDVADVDADGDEDLAVLGFEPGTSPLAGPLGAPVIALLVNDQTGSLDVTRVARLPLLPQLQVRSFRFIQADADAPLELFVATNEAIYLVNLAYDLGGASPLVAVERVETVADRSLDSQQFVYLSVADFNGDGIEDLAYSTYEGAGLAWLRLGVSVIQ